MLFDTGFDCVRLSIWDVEYQNQETVDTINRRLGDEIAVESVWDGWNSGPVIGNFIEESITLMRVIRDVGCDNLGNQY